MCGRYSFSVEDDLIWERFHVRVRTAIFKARYNCGPTQELAVISNETPDQLSFYRWGLIPSWTRDPSIGNKMINARSETILEKPSFRSSFRSRRCLVLADSFFEWKKGKEKIPFRILLQNRLPFAMAGIWDRWSGPDGMKTESFSILTTRPNSLMSKIHDRMPVILPREIEKKWLEKTPEVELLEMLAPYPDGEMEAYQVSPLVNSPLHDTPDIIKPFDSILI